MNSQAIKQLVDEHGDKIDVFFQHLNDQLQSQDEEIVSGLRKAGSLYMVFVLSGEPGGIWTIQVDDGTGQARKISRAELDAEKNKPTCKIETSVKTMIKIATGQRRPATAFLKREVKFSGDRSAFQCLRLPMERAGQNMAPVLESIKSQLGAVAPPSTSGMNFGAIFVRSSDAKWVKDEDCPNCVRCGATFWALNRRHHCRLCGQVVCGTCSSNSLSGKRVCDFCYRDRLIGPANPAATPGKGGAMDTVIRPGAGSAKSPSAKSSQRTDEFYLPYSTLRNRIAREQRRPIHTSITAPEQHSLLNFARGTLSKVRSLEKTVAALQGQSLRTMFTSSLLNAIPKLVVGLPLLWSWMNLLVGGETTTGYFSASARVVMSVSAIILYSKWWKLSGLVAGAVFASTVAHQVTADVSGLASLLASSLPSALWSTALKIGSALATRYLMVLFMVPPALLFTIAHHLFGRIIRIYTVAGINIALYLSIHLTLKYVITVSDSTKERIYDSLDVVVAPFLCSQFVHLKSIFVKFGQYISTRADVIPPTWSKALARLQDEMPFDSPSYVERTLAEEFGKPFNELFESFEFEPMASASIAQVHKGVLRCEREGGIEIAVKVQHENIEQIILSDMVATRRILKIIVWLNSDFELLAKLQFAWEKEMLKELDFHTEADNLRHVQKNLQDAGLIAGPNNNCKTDQVLVPRVLDEYVAKRAFCMTFIDGFKITDMEQLDLYGVDKTDLLYRVVQAYAYQLYVDGFFNADPHAGNLMVAIDKRDNVAKPVLLDFGMVITLSEKDRRAYCELMLAISQLNISGLAEAIRAVGYKNSQSDLHPERDLEFFQFLVRDTGDGKNARAELKEFHKKRIEQREADKLIDPNSKGRRFTHFPDSLIFLFRVLSLLRGLCTTMSAEIPYLNVMADYAQLALFQNFDKAAFSKRLLSPNSSAAKSSMQDNVKQLVIRLMKGDTDDDDEDQQSGDDVADPVDGSSIVGIQVHVRKAGKPVIDLAGGVRGIVDPRPVEPNTLFPVLDLTQVVESLAVARAVDAGKVKFTDPIRKHWADFASDQSPIAKSQLTVAHVMSHTKSGLEDAVPPSSSYLRVTRSKENMNNLVECDVQDPTVAGKHFVGAYHTLSFGHAVKGVMEAVYPTQAVQDVVAREVVNACLKENSSTGISRSELQYGALDSDNVATISNGFAKTIHQMMAGGGTGDMGSSPQMGVPGRVLMDPGMVNLGCIKKEVVPSLNLYASARALATVLDRSFNHSSMRISKPVLAEMSRVYTKEVNQLFGTWEWGLGFQVFKLVHAKTGASHVVLAHHAFGGSFAMVCPALKITCVVVVNNLSLDRNDTREIVTRVCSLMEIGDATPMFDGGMF